jgi:hypothetical protein
MKNDSSEAGTFFIGQSADSHPSLSVDARMSEHRDDGSVVGSYDAATMENLMHYHNLPEAAAAAGAMVMGGELIEG